MWSKELNKEIPTTAYWCSKCSTPVIRPRSDKELCPLCSTRMKNLSPSIRPVFPAEVRLLELLTGHDLNFKSVWKGKVSYYVNGKSLKITNRLRVQADDKMLRNELLGKVFDRVFFNDEMTRFIKANNDHLAYITQEAIDFVREQVASHPNNNIMVATSGGKDSTVTSDIVCRALPSQKIKHIFGDTTLEIDTTHEYIKRAKKNKQIELHVARNNDSNFFEMAKQLGPPTMKCRWCCYMFKTGATNRKMQELFTGDVLSFNGVRRSESSTRASYTRTESITTCKKIASQKNCYPILYWSEFEVWLYILANRIDFNEAYTWGYKRVGCYTCPNTTISADLIEKIYNHKKYKAWMDIVTDFAIQGDKGELSTYIDEGGWKMRIGGDGAKAAYTVKLKKTNCTTEENGMSYELYRDLHNDFYNLFLPFGKIIDGRGAIGEKLILHPTSQVPYVSLQPLNSRTIKIVTLNAQRPHSLHSRLAYQVIKWNACAQCLKCESLCKHNAIEVKPKKYCIDESKCTKCQACVNPKYLPGGCLMTRYLRTRKEAV